MTLSKDTVLDILRQIQDPFSKKDIISAEIVRALTVEGNDVRFVMEVEAQQGLAMESVRKTAVEALEKLPEVGNISALITAHSNQAPPPDLKQSGAKRPPAKGPQKIAGVKKIIAIASGKGGVGKSTVSSNLAVALAAEGKRVGLLDADVYGPSQPRMMGISGKPASPDGKIILPLENHGVTMMSIGLMVKEGEAVIWRGPMLIGALTQLLMQVQWGELDVLLVDLPPGTGDVQLTLTQKAKIDGAIIVSTPQDVALLDARKALDMFRKTGTKVLGMIENMSTHICSECGHEEHIFGHGGMRAEAKQFDFPFLGEVPLHINIRLGGDSGVPIVVSAPESGQAMAFKKIAKDLIENGVI